MISVQTLKDINLYITNDKGILTNKTTEEEYRKIIRNILNK